MRSTSLRATRSAARRCCFWRPRRPDRTTRTPRWGAYQAQYPQNAWFAAVQPVEDRLRQARRDALVAYLLGPGPATSPGAVFLTTDDIFNYYLIDPEMCACGETTRLLQPSLAIQQFVQQCFLNLTIDATVDTSDPRWNEWSWRQQYQLWQANREVFLYPENYLLPESRRDASSFFTDLENDLRQTNCDADAVETAFQNYLRKLVNVSRLVVAAHYNEINPDGSKVLHVFARTRGTPPQWFYRTRTSPTPGSGVWSAWTSLNLDIASVHLLPVVWDRRLHLVWPIFKEESQEPPENQTIPTAPGGGTATTAKKYWAVEFAMSEFSAGQWQPKRTIAEKMFFTKSFITDLPPQAFTFRAFQDPAMNLQIDAYYNPGPVKAVRVAIGTLSMPEAPMSVLQSRQELLPPPEFIDPAQEPSYALITTDDSGEHPEHPDRPHAIRIFGTGSGLRILPSRQSRSGAAGRASPIDKQRTTAQRDAAKSHRQPAHRRAASGGRLRQHGSVLRRRSGSLLPGAAALLHDFKLAAGARPSRLCEAVDDPVRVRDLLSSLCADLPPRAGNRRNSAADVAQSAAQSADRARLAHDFQLPVALRAHGRGGNALSRCRDRVDPSAPNAPDPGETALDFTGSSSGAYSLYNWEIFYHAPMFIASLLMQNRSSRTR